jgi:hypothetical protein
MYSAPPAIPPTPPTHTHTHARLHPSVSGNSEDEKCEQTGIHLQRMCRVRSNDSRHVGDQKLSVTISFKVKSE